MSRDTHKRLFNCEQDNKAETSTNSCPTNKIYYERKGKTQRVQNSLRWRAHIHCTRFYLKLKELRVKLKLQTGNWKLWSVERIPYRSEVIQRGGGWQHQWYICECWLENSNSGKKSFDSIRFANLINLSLVHWYSNSNDGEFGEEPGVVSSRCGSFCAISVSIRQFPTS